MNNDNPGLGVMLAALSETGETGLILNEVKGKQITGLQLRKRDEGADKFYWEDSLVVGLDHGEAIRIYDGGQSCCEYRYMTTDDDLDAYVGADFIDIEVRNGPDIDAGYDVHEVQFLLVNTSLGTFTMETHNEHNGYYGGFYAQVRRLE